MHLEQCIRIEEEAIPFHRNFGKKLNVRTEWTKASEFTSLVTLSLHYRIAFGEVSCLCEAEKMFISPDLSQFML